ncbi:MAG: PD-(D/E)XK nuclease family protein [Proteobacteria bacterium]|nr:PD-(D/E)XK nuclease family protein [Pseudomonadota bacterium]
MNVAQITPILRHELAQVGIFVEGARLELLGEKLAFIGAELDFFGIDLGMLSARMESMGGVGEVLFRVLVGLHFKPTGRQRLEHLGDGAVPDGILVPRVEQVVAERDWEAVRLAALIAADKKLRVVVGDAVLAKRLVGELARFGVGAEQVLTLEAAWRLGVLADSAGVVLLGAVAEHWPKVVADPWLPDGVRASLGLPHVAWWRQLGDAVLRRALQGGFGRQVLVVGFAVSGEEVVQAHRLVAELVGENTVEVWREIWRQRVAAPRVNNRLGAWVPRGAQYPAKWSASMVQDLLACPYKAVAERVLRLVAPPPLDDPQSALAGGLLMHAWLERLGRGWRELRAMDEAAAVVVIRAWGEEILAEEELVVQAIWRPKMQRLAPELFTQWRAHEAEENRQMVAVEERLAWRVAQVEVSAKIDRLERGAGGMVVVDFKTGGLPSVAEMADGRKPQLPLEAWLVEANGRGAVAQVEHWKLRGYGSQPLEIEAANAAPLVAPVGEALVRLAGKLAPGAAFAALPDQAGGGIVASGHCEHCQLSGVCRRGLA